MVKSINLKRDSFDNNYMPLVEIKDFNALLDNKAFSDQPIENKQKVLKSLSKC